MIGKYTLDRLNQDSVSVLYQKFTDEGEQLGSSARKAYVNSIRGRQKVKEELPSPQKEAIFSVWGDTPTVDESIAD